MQFGQSRCVVAVITLRNASFSRRKVSTGWPGAISLRVGIWTSTSRVTLRVKVAHRPDFLNRHSFGYQFLFHGHDFRRVGLFYQFAAFAAALVRVPCLHASA